MSFQDDSLQWTSYNANSGIFWSCIMCEITEYVVERLVVYTYSVFYFAIIIMSIVAGGYVFLFS